MEHRRLGPLEPGAEWGSGGDRPAPGAAQTVPKGSRAGTACGVPGTLYLEHLLHGGGSSCCGFASLGARDRPQRWPGLWDEGFQCADDGPALLAEGHAFGAGERPGGWEGDSPVWALGTARQEPLQESRRHVGHTACSGLLCSSSSGCNQLQSRVMKLWSCSFTVSCIALSSWVQRECASATRSSLEKTTKLLGSGHCQLAELTLLF